MDLLSHAAHLYHSLSHLSHSMSEAHSEMTTSTFHRATETVEFLRLKLPLSLAKPKIAIVCGSGLGGLAETVNAEQMEEWSYGDVPGFPQSTGKSRSWKTFGYAGYAMRG
jgi:purine-nucleoside phosphorylase